MFIIKYFISSILLAAPGVIDENGWVAVDRPEKRDPVESFDDVDRSIWVVFAKQIGEEKILVSFPEDPSYRYMDEKGEEMEATAVLDGAEYRFQVMKKLFSSSEELLDYRKEVLEGAGAVAQKASEPGEPPVIELTYWKEGYWYFEKLVSTPNHTYFFQTKSISMEDAAHLQFVDSFDLEIARKNHF